MSDASVLYAARTKTNGANVHRIANLLTTYTLACEAEDKLLAALSIAPESQVLRIGLKAMRTRKARDAGAIMEAN